MAPRGEPAAAEEPTCIVISDDDEPAPCRVKRTHEATLANQRQPPPPASRPSRTPATGEAAGAGGGGAHQRAAQVPLVPAPAEDDVPIMQRFARHPGGTAGVPREREARGVGHATPPSRAPAGEGEEEDVVLVDEQTLTREQREQWEAAAQARQAERRRERVEHQQRAELQARQARAAREREEADAALWQAQLRTERARPRADVGSAPPPARSAPARAPGHGPPAWGSTAGHGLASSTGWQDAAASWKAQNAPAEAMAPPAKSRPKPKRQPKPAPQPEPAQQPAPEAARARAAAGAAPAAPPMPWPQAPPPPPAASAALEAAERVERSAELASQAAFRAAAEADAEAQRLRDGGDSGAAAAQASCEALRLAAEAAACELRRARIKADAARSLAQRQAVRVQEVRERAAQGGGGAVPAQGDAVRSATVEKLRALTANCKTMGALLNAFNFPPQGWPRPTPEAVTAAYRKAALAFHPDRTRHLDKMTPSHVLGREEAFKLLTRMKEEKGLT